MKTKLLHILFFLCVSAAHSMPCATSDIASANRQAGEGKDTVQIYHRSLEETVVKATPTSSTVRSATPTFSINDSAILKTGITDIADAIHRLPGVTLKDYGGAGGMKTASIRGLGATHTSVIYDGIPLTDAQNGSIDLSRYSVDNLSSLELIIGDNNDIFIPAKTAAAPASLSINTPLPDDTKPFMLSTQLKIGSFDYVSPYLRIAKKLSEKLTVGGTGEFIYTRNNYPFKLKNGIETTTEYRDNSEMKSGHGEIFVNLKFNPGSSLNSKIYYYENSRQLPGPVLYYNVGNNHEHLNDRNAFAQSEYTNSINEKWKLRISGKFNYSSTLYTDYGSISQGQYIAEDYYQREYYMTANLLYTPIDNLFLDYSADYDYNNLNSNLKTDVRPRRSALLQSLTGKYTISRFTVLVRLIQSNYFNSSKKNSETAKTYSRLSPSIALNFKILRTLPLYVRVSYKNIFRSPTFSEAYFNHFGSSNLKPETTDQFDIGLGLETQPTTWMPYLRFTADLYLNKVRDRIVAIPYNMFIWTITNLEHVQTRGADITINSTFNLGQRQQLILTASWSYIRAKIGVTETSLFYGKQIAYTPKNSGSFSLSYENPWVNFIVHGQGSSAKYSQNSNIPETRIPGYFEIGLTAWRQFNIGKHKIELRFDIMNLLDKQYSVIARYPMPGRSCMFSIKYNL